MMNQPESSQVDRVVRQKFTHRGRGDGMVISLPGILDRAAAVCKRSRDMKHLEFMLSELKRHINMMRECKTDEEALDLLDRFLALYVDD